MTFAERILEKHQLRRTKGRLAVLELFAEHGKAFSHSEIHQKIREKVDRVTLYRILSSMEDKGILHKIPDDEVSVKYALCDHHASHKHSDDHIHFKCESCGDTICFEDHKIPSFDIP